MKILKINYEKCTGCRACEMVCSLAHTGECSDRKSNIHNINMNDEAFLSIACFQCEDAPCAKVCPMDAIEKDPNTGVVSVDEDKCVGCKLCVLACPFGNMAFSAEKHRPAKCDLCGGDPLCAFYCSPGAITLVDVDDENLTKKTVLSEQIMKVYCTQEESNG